MRYYFSRSFSATHLSQILSWTSPMPQKLQNITNTDCLINENRADFEKTRETLRSYPISLNECARMMCSFLFAAFVSCLQRSFFVCSIRFLFAAFLIFAVLVFSLQRTFLFVAFLFCLQRFFFVCSVSILFAACPLWAIVHSSLSCSFRCTWWTHLSAINRQVFVVVVFQIRAHSPHVPSSHLASTKTGFSCHKNGKWRLTAIIFS